MTKKKRFSYIVLGILPLLIATGIMYLLLIPCMGLGMAYSINLSALNPGSGAFDIFAQLVSSSLFNDIYSLIFAATVALVFGYWFISTVKPAHTPLLRKKFLSPSIIIGILLLAVGLQYMSSLLSTITGTIFPQVLENYMELIEAAGLTDPTFLTLLYGVLIGPVAEEFIFRGVSLGYLKKALPFWLANIIQAALFGIYHGNILQGIYTFFVGMFFGYIFHESGSILLSILLHMVYNFYSFSGIIYIGSNSTFFSFFWIPAMVVCLVAGLTLYITGCEKQTFKLNNSAASSDM